MRISDWSSDVCSSDLLGFAQCALVATATRQAHKYFRMLRQLFLHLREQLRRLLVLLGFEHATRQADDEIGLLNFRLVVDQLLVGMDRQRNLPRGLQQLSVTDRQLAILRLLAPRLARKSTR